MVIAEVPDESFGNLVAVPPEGSTTTIEVAGRKIQVNLKAHIAWVDTGMVRTMVTAPASAGLSEAELAAVAASTT